MHNSIKERIGGLTDQLEALSVRPIANSDTDGMNNELNRVRGTVEHIADEQTRHWESTQGGVIKSGRRYYHPIRCSDNMAAFDKMAKGLCLCLVISLSLANDWCASW